MEGGRIIKIAQFALKHQTKMHNGYSIQNLLLLLFYQKSIFLMTPSCLHLLVLGLTGLGPLSVQLTLPTFLLGVVKPGAATRVLHFILENGQNN